MAKKYVLRTKNFYSGWLWVERTFTILLIAAMAYYLELRYPGSIDYTAVCVVVAMLFFLLLPVTDVALDQQNFYYIKKSIFPSFGLVRKYKFSDIKKMSFTKENSQRYDMLKILFSPSWYDARIVLADKKVVEMRMHKRDIEILK